MKNVLRKLELFFILFVVASEIHHAGRFAVREQGRIACLRRGPSK